MKHKEMIKQGTARSMISKQYYENMVQFQKNQKYYEGLVKIYELLSDIAICDMDYLTEDENEIVSQFNGVLDNLIERYQNDNASIYNKLKKTIK